MKLFYFNNPNMETNEVNQNGKIKTYKKVAIIAPSLEMAKTKLPNSDYQPYKEFDMHSNWVSFHFN